MTSSGVRHFFVLEASEYVERLDALVTNAGSEGPEADALLRVSRALRGASSMARLEALVGLGAAVERVSRGLRDGAIAWGDELHAALSEAVADLRTLIGRAREWDSSEDALAQARTSALLALVPPEMGSPTGQAGAGGAQSAGSEAVSALAASGGTLHLVNGTGELAAALSASVDRPDDHNLLADLRRRAGALRGVAAVADHAPLEELLDALDNGLRSLESPLPRPAQTSLASASRVLRRAAEDLRAGRPIDPDAEWRAATDSASRLGTVAEEAVVPIGHLFHDDPGPHVLEEASEPPVTPLARFRMESAGQAEHLRRLVADAREAGRPDERAATRIEAALLALRDVADSYGETRLARLIASGAEAAVKADRLTLDAVDALATRLLAEAGSVEELCDRLTDLARGHHLAAMMGSGFAAFSGNTPTRSFTPRSLTAVVAGDVNPQPVSPERGDMDSDMPSISRYIETPVRTPVVTAPAGVPIPDELPVEISTLIHTPGRGTAAVAGEPPQHSGTTHAQPVASEAPPARRTTTPTGQALHDFLQDGLAGFRKLDEGPLAQPTAVEDEIVPIDSLLYDAAGALERARELRAELRAAAAPAPQETLEEIFDLLELAARG